MTKSLLLSACALSALGLAWSPAAAQVGTTAPAAEAELPAEEPQAEPPAEAGPGILVTGSLIRGTPEDAALPVDVISSEELAKQGSPSALDLIKNLPVSNGVIGDANQFDSRAQGSEGVASINLRGLGPERTLVLLNGRRMVPAGTGVPVVDVNLLPQAAIGRVEILKDGAAATYGSDAIAGVVNFITRDRQEGFIFGGDYRYIKGSNGDWTANGSYGHSGDGFRMLAAFGYQHRSQLATTERDFLISDYASNPQGGYSAGGNPGNFDFNGSAVGGVTFVRDLGCTSLGGFRSLPGSSQDRCAVNYNQFGNLIEPEQRLQAYAEVEFDIGDRGSLNVNFLYGNSRTQITTSPTYLPTLPPSANAALGGGGVFVVPAYAPALRDYCTTYGAAAGCAVVGGVLQSALAFPVLFRPALLGGNPTEFSDDNYRGSAIGPRKSDSFRISAVSTTELTDTLTLESSATYHYYERYIEGTDSFGDLVQNALAGFGGINCPYQTPQSRAGLSTAQLAALAGTNGCVYLNPFSTAVAVNPVTGQVNPNFAGTRNPTGLSTAPGAGLINSAEVFDYFFVRTGTTTETELYVGDLVLSGQPGIALPGGDVGFALGLQYRRQSYDVNYNAVSDLNINPCPGSVLNPAATCNPQTGALGFLGTNRPRSINGDVYAAFAELQLPVTDAINVQLSARYEDYGGQTGSTFDPQGRVRVQLTDWLAVRGGAGTTFRGPPPQSLDGSTVSLQVIGQAFRAIDVVGNAALEPESATTYNAGILLDSGPLTASIDYFRYEFDGPISGEPVAGIVNALFPGGAAQPANNNCTNPAYAGLVSRFTFTGAGCGIGNVQRLTTNLINSANVRTSGIDAQVNLRFELLETELQLGAAGTYVIDYRIDDVVVEGITVQPSFDAVGLLNYQTTAYPLPQVKGQIYLQADQGPHSGRIQFNYIDGYTDQRAAPFLPNTDFLAGAAVTTGKEIGAFKTVDITYRLALDTGTSLSISAQNIFDEDPPFARLDQNYDPFTANPLGANVKVGVTQQF